MGELERLIRVESNVEHLRAQSEYLRGRVDAIYDLLSGEAMPRLSTRRQAVLTSIASVISAVLVIALQLKGLAPILNLLGGG